MAGFFAPLPAMGLQGFRMAEQDAERIEKQGWERQDQEWQQKQRQRETGRQAWMDPLEKERVTAETEIAGLNLGKAKRENQITSQTDMALAEKGLTPGMLAAQKILTEHDTTLAMHFAGQVEAGANPAAALESFFNQSSVFGDGHKVAISPDGKSFILNDNGKQTVLSPQNGEDLSQLASRIILQSVDAPGAVEERRKLAAKQAEYGHEINKIDREGTWRLRAAMANQTTAGGAGGSGSGKLDDVDLGVLKAYASVYDPGTGQDHLDVDLFSALNEIAGLRARQGVPSPVAVSTAKQDWDRAYAAARRALGNKFSDEAELDKAAKGAALDHLRGASGLRIGQTPPDVKPQGKSGGTSKPTIMYDPPKDPKDMTDFGKLNAQAYGQSQASEFAEFRLSADEALKYLDFSEPFPVYDAGGKQRTAYYGPGGALYEYDMTRGVARKLQPQEAEKSRAVGQAPGLRPPPDSYFQFGKQPAKR